MSKFNQSKLSNFVLAAILAGSMVVLAPALSFADEAGSAPSSDQPVKVDGATPSDQGAATDKKTEDGAVKTDDSSKDKDGTTKTDETPKQDPSNPDQQPKAD